MTTPQARSEWKRAIVVCLLIAVAAAAARTGWVMAAAGDLDPTFGTGGVVLTDAPAPYCCEGAGAVAIQADGRIIVGGSLFDTTNTQAADNDFALVRYTPDGVLDATFGIGGIVTTKFVPNSSDDIRAVAIQSDGKIVAAGNTRLAGTEQFALARYLPDGRLDATFGAGGKVAIGLSPDNVQAYALALQADGRIVVAGAVVDGFFGKSDFALARVNSDGSPDLSFGAAGWVTTPFLDQPDLSDPFQQPYDVAQALVIQPDGKIVAAGYSNLWPDFNGDMVVVRYTATGIPDSSFGTAGKVRLDFYGDHDDVTGAALQPDGRIVVTGAARNRDPFLRYEFAAARLDPNGIPDQTFDGDGKVATRIEPLDARGAAMALQPDGRIVVVGSYGNDFAVVRYRSNGALDTSFSTDGVASFDRGGYEFAGAVAVQSDGRIVTAGSALPITGGGNLATFLVVRFDGGAGTLDQTIDFAPLPDRTFGDPPFAVSATATSGLPVTFSATGACTISGSTVTLTGSGTCSITASQDGNDTYAPAPDVTRNFQVLNARTLTVTVDGTGSGAVTSSPQGIDCGTDCTETYLDGAVVTLVPNASTGSTFVGFGGDSDCSDGTVTLTSDVACTATFDRTATMTTVSSSLNPSIFGAPVTFTVVVSGSNPSGSVTVRDGATTLGSGLALSNGSASITVSTLTAGTHTITAQYSGDTSHAGSTSSPLSQLVNKASPTVTLLSSRNPSAPGELVTLSGALPDNATGTVTILDGTASLGDATIAGGAFALSLSTLSAGSHVLKARYNGDDNYLPADSVSLTQVVEVINNPPQISQIGDQAVTWGSLLQVPVFATDADLDPLTFSLVGAPAGAAITSGGQFTWTPADAQIGLHMITVQVTDGKASDSMTFRVTVSKRLTGVSYLGPAAAAPGPVELSGRLAEVPSNAPLSGRTLVFQLGTQSVSGTTDATGLATASLVLDQPVGVISVSAAFPGDSAYEGASTGSANFRVDALPVPSPVPAQAVPWGRTVSFVVQASDPDGDALTWSLISAPAGVSLVFVSPTQRSVVWTPTQSQAGAASITIGISDGIATVPFTVAVDVLRHATTLTRLGPGAGTGNVTVSATLIDAEFGSPVSQRPVTFTLGAVTAPGTTDGSGVAGAMLSVLQAPQTIALIASFAGDPAYAPAQAIQPFVIYADTDGDGIRDEWEINGVDTNGDGAIDLNLPAMGANPLRKDVFIEVDWMVKPTACVWFVCWSNGGVLQPQRPVLDELIARLRTAPVSNPDGSIGINLHIDGGPNTVMNPITGELWGVFSRAGVVPYDQFLGTSDGVSYDWSEFDAVKQAFMDPARRAVFHYALYADTLGGVNASGISRGIPAADFVLAAGDPGWNGGLTVTQERSLFLHELGHNLALHHGGGDDINYKPNYHSVLNYRWALIGVPPDNRADYSNVVEPAVDESLTGDANGDGRLDTLFGYVDWPNLVFTGGGLGDLAPLPPPAMTPVDHIDPDELRARGAYARAGEGLLDFRGPSVVAANSGIQPLAVDVTNISTADAEYSVSVQSAMLAGPLTATSFVPAGATVRVSLPVNTSGLAPGEYFATFTLLGGGEMRHRRTGRVVVVDLSVPENQLAAREAIQALGALPPDSGLDPAVLDQIIEMLESAAVTWTASIAVSGREAFDAVYDIAEPGIERAPGRIRAVSLAGSALFELNLVRAGKAASGVVRMHRPDGGIFEAPIAGSWQEATRVFEGKWLDGKRAGGTIVITLREQ